MKSLPSISVVMLLCCLQPVPGNCDDFSWPMFVPATTNLGGGELTCGNIAGCYDGLFTDNCPGTSVSGRINLTVREDCSFSSFSNYGVQTNGIITSRNGSTYSGSGQSDSNGCGAFNISCSNNGTSLACNYQYSSGASGSIPNATQGACKSLNRLKTEMLAGYWRFTYQIISIFNSYYYLNINEVEESSFSPGEYNIFGTDEYGGLVVAGYDPAYDDYTLLDSGSIIDRFYVFNFSGGGIVSGCYYQIDNSDGSWSRCYAMSGVLLSLTRNAATAKTATQPTQNEKESQAKQEVNDLESKDMTAKSNKRDPSIRELYDRLKAIYSNK